ncbi:atrial natriuretic peptide receptor 1-like [Rhineura floridana]|uniref:atrial natriuretic peptide receptor 1-like n=1 Tax=Rhineura floridana TaxID=261503 RepID=UPI002AC88797|nr:atrial natriuretic peptide receptor 1-like [Rhineura floridana]XP_061473778.1 atrial natriuretic peptide receptor 1-like [Rhineura floridana]XP_061473861.1 atrial natriuretic peptide receptor 1-like [Rhineura floridana]
MRATTSFSPELQIILSLLAVIVKGWHDLDNTDYDCWPLEKPDEYNMLDCGGLEMAWVQRPPEKVISGESFDVIYAVFASDYFYHYSVENGILSHSDAMAAKKFCEEQECPPNWKDANGENCCVHHANIHSCPLAFMGKGGICGPWIPDDGQIFTHTISTAGKMTQTNWTAKVVLVHVGMTSLIAHIRVGRMQAALEAQTMVLPAVVCGDDICEDDEGCSTCPADCGECPLTTDVRIAIALPVCLVCTGFILTVVWFQYQKQKMFWDESWIIDFRCIKQEHMTRTAVGSTLSVPHAPSASNTSCLTTLSSCTAPANASKMNYFTQIGTYDGRTVAIKKIMNKTFTITKTIRKEVKQVRELDHPNLCKFIGGCTEVPNIAIITEYCPKGSLNDVLLNEDIPLNWGFRLSFATDIAQGMAYLHQHRIYHGRLKSSNCVIDDRWACKISDYGLQSYRKDDSLMDSNVPHQHFMQIYLAPEAHSVPSFEPTPAADVYSYAIILLIIATRSDPTLKDDTPSEEYSLCLPLAELISEKSENACPCPTEYVELIRRCRKSNPAQRLTFEQVKKLLHKMNPNKVSPVDMMMTLMEKYSKHLEVLVAERTQDLMHEKQKTDRLLYSMLPKQVADDLRQGKPSQAQSYINSTVFFSDIVGFTQLSSTSTPYQVVEFLNKLYTTFDEIIDNYDVYKVETIGDAYMVVSGVPKENGIRHASEIASMALDLILVCKTFRIPHKPNTQLKIRAGIHSGPVVAGVVGTKMPRYCLFGDTVNTASRMESTSEALKIQCSSNTYQLLEQIGEYVLVCRGNLQVKGKGDMITYWLEGKKASTAQKKALSPSATSQMLNQNTFSIIPGVL